jgi:uncharacterized OsmC-like protein
MACLAFADKGRNNPGLRGTNKVRTEMEGQYRSLSYVGNHAPVVVDEPLHLFGQDTAPAPGEIVLSGLGGCLAVGITAVATWKQVKLSKIEIHMEGDIGNPAAWGAGGALQKTPPEMGFQAIRVKVVIEGDATREQCSTRSSSTPTTTRPWPTPCATRFRHSRSVLVADCYRTACSIAPTHPPFPLTPERPAMNANDLPKDIAQTAIQHDLMGAVRAIAQGPLAQRAQSIDQEGLYPQDLLQQLAAVGGMSAHLDQRARPVTTRRPSPPWRKWARSVVPSAFMMWCQAVCGLYMQHIGQPCSDRRACCKRHMQGLGLGGTGLSNPMKSFAQIENLLLKATPIEGGGYRVNGTLPWISNLAGDHYFGAIAAVMDGEHERRARGHVHPEVRCTRRHPQGMPQVLGYGGHGHLRRAVQGPGYHPSRHRGRPGHALTSAKSAQHL